MRTVHVLVLTFLLAGCAPLRDDVLTNAYKVGTSRANLDPLIKQMDLVLYAAQSRPENGWSSRIKDVFSAPEKLGAMASAFERDHPGILVHWAELYYVPQPNSLSIPDLTGDSVEFYHGWFFNAQTNLIGVAKSYGHEQLHK